MGWKLLPSETVVLERGRSRVAIAPERGAIVTRFEVGSKPVLFLDESTLSDPQKNVRGGIPVLFPSPGPLPEDRFAFGGKTGFLKQHGFARAQPFEVRERRTDSVLCTLASNPVTARGYPFPHELEIQYVLEEARLNILTRVTNTGDSPLPYALGFHPYFLVPVEQKESARVPTDARHAFDNVTKSQVALHEPIRLDRGEVDLHLEGHSGGQAHLTLGNGSRVIVSGDDSFGRWVLWTLEGKDFVCVEPWTAPKGALATGDGLIVLEPRQSRSHRVSIEAG